jgi:hypothetical protein
MSLEGGTLNMFVRTGMQASFEVSGRLELRSDSFSGSWSESSSWPGDFFWSGQSVAGGFSVPEDEDDLIVSESWGWNEERLLDMEFGGFGL